MIQRSVYLSVAMVATGLVLSACGGDEDGNAQRPATSVTVALAREQVVERVERSVGRLAAVTAPNVASETAGRVVDVFIEVGDAVEAGQVLARLDGDSQRSALEAARGEVERLEALSGNQRARADRLAQLLEDQLVSLDQFAELEAQARALESQLASAKAQWMQATLNLERTEIRAPLAGAVQARRVSVGDFVNTGQMVFEIVSPQALQAFLPLPQRLGSVIEVGQVVRLQLVSSDETAVEHTITEVRPAVGQASRAIEAVVSVNSPGAWRAGASVIGEIVLNRRNGVVVPRTSVVKRPAGEVVYLVDPNTNQAREQRVSLGVRQADWVEVLAGVKPGDVLVQDGAGFLTDGALLSISNNPSSETLP